MKINAKQFGKFLEKVSVSNGILECGLDFSEKGLKILTASIDNTTHITAALAASKFEGYSALGKIAVDDFSKLVKLVKLFGTVDISVKGNLLRLSEGNKVVEVELLDTKFLPDVNEMKELAFTENIDLPIAEIQSFVTEAAAMNKEVDLIITTTEKAVLLNNTGKYKFTRTIPAEKAIGGVKVKFKTPMFNAIANLEGIVTLSLSNDFPAKILEKQEGSNVSLVVAPVIEEA